MSAAAPGARPLKAPFPAFGGKSQVAGLVWSRFGDVRNYIEPFAFSGAVLLRRPGGAGAIETINDVNSYVANFWRAVQRDPDAVAAHADWPVNEADLHARHRWLVRSDDARLALARVREDPGYFHARIAGWWCWGACMWIGSGWCDETHRNAAGEQRQDLDTGQLVTALAPVKLDRQPIYITGDGKGNGVSRGPVEKMPHADAAGRMVHSPPALWDGRGSGVQKARGVQSMVEKRAKLSGNGVGNGVHAEGVTDGYGRRPALSQDGWGANAGGGPDDAARPQLADAYSRGRGVHGGELELATCARRRAWLTDWMLRLADRLRAVRVCCGDWRRVCDSESTLTRLGLTGVFLDPPYRKRLADGSANRAAHIYANDRSQDVGALCDGVQDWCLRWGQDPSIRVILCGLEGEYPGLDAAGWEKVAWKSRGGYGNRSAKGKANAERERLWLSPACARGLVGGEPGLF